MKRSNLLLTVALFALAFGAFAQSPKPAVNKMTNMPYKVENTNLKFGSSMYAMQVLQAWKAWDDNELDKMSGMFSDDFWGTLADGTVVKGKEAFLKGGTEYRSSFSSVSSEVIACTTLKSAEHPDNDAVVIWGRETDVKKDGTSQKAALHEVWFFNKAGKVFEFHQYASPIKEEMK
ncbi:DUF4440 domain-containing protein [Flavisolibacter ginsenosidimutans]|uniref:DUF4440 domain-containing protein n=1 Tax=Flavisolibacter ginsenosidimutans TaxID=661481 RepID=A0A5B8UPD9_9BACT|nr:DUF4440 domain-containing protein [Flavisolibacter ginsenosidimutans]QEC58099.1 hypothetical protein FSB75_20040 [Flavisolibacter ginsenosidimutans]